MSQLCGKLGVGHMMERWRCHFQVGVGFGDSSLQGVTDSGGEEGRGHLKGAGMIPPTPRGGCLECWYLTPPRRDKGGLSSLHH